MNELVQNYFNLHSYSTANQCTNKLEITLVKLGYGMHTLENGFTKHYHLES